MNKLEAQITKIQISQGVQLVDLHLQQGQLTAMLIEAHDKAEWLSVGNRVWAVFKETEVSIAKQWSGAISMRNRLDCVVENIVRGDLLSIVHLQFGNNTMQSAITTRSVEQLNLQIGETVTALIKANEVSLMKAL